MNKKNQPNQDRSAVKAPEDWVTGDEPMTGAQESYVHTLAREAGEDVPQDLTKAEASAKIEELQEKTDRGGQGPRQRKNTAGRKKSGANSPA